MKRVIRPLLFFFLLFLVAFFTGKYLRFEKKAKLFDIELMPAAGQKTTWKDLQRKKILLFAGFTNCPDVCPASLVTLVSAFKSHPGLEDKIHSIFLSVDPERDTPERLKTYLNSYKHSIQGFTGTRFETEKIQSVLNIFSEKTVTRPPGQPYGVNHTYFFYLINESGDIVKVMPGTSDISSLSEALKQFASE